jgi:hypothetical protein
MLNVKPAINYLQIVHHATTVIYIIIAAQAVPMDILPTPSWQYASHVE